MRAAERLLAAALLLGAGAAEAHSRSVSYSDWQRDGDALAVELRLPLRELNPLGLDPHDPQVPVRIAARVREEFVPSAGGAACVALDAQGRVHGDAVVVEAHWRCPQPADALRARFLLDAIPGHLHLLQLHEDGRLRGPWALSGEHPQLDWRETAAGATPPATLPRYFALGGEHILSGWDHLAYLAVVLLGAATLAQLAWRVTGFTLGHSLTLALAALGWVRPQPAMVEAFIALTIACTAAERTLAGQPRAALHAGGIAAVLGLAGGASGTLPWALGLAAVLLTAGAAAMPATQIDSLRTALFGLFHGFGFAGVLMTLTRGAPLPLLPLAGFNLGVEAGQLLFVLPLWALLHRWPRLRSPWTAAALLAVGCALFFVRLY